MSRAVLSIGSNLGDRLAHLQRAIEALRPWLVAASPVYQTPPWGPVAAARFLNAVLVVADPGAGHGTGWPGRRRPSRPPVAAGGALGTAHPGCRRDRRRRRRQRRSPLTLPHPRAAERAFVLVPWSALDPSAELGGRPVVALIAGLDPDDVAQVQPVPEMALH